MKSMLSTIVMILSAIPALAQDPGWIGITIRDQADGGAVVRRVEPNSPAEKAGFKEGDVILEYNREQVMGVQQLTRLVRETPVGRSVDVKVRRDTREETLKVTAERSSQFAFEPGQHFDFDVPNVRLFADRAAQAVSRIEMTTVRVEAGIRVEQLTDQLREFFGASGSNGVLVTSVDSGSAADKAGLKAGDVIIAIDGRTIRNPSDFSREMRAGDAPALKILRQKQEREIKLQ